ncbi:MAG: FAD-dependent thymidylate synthase [Alphaproteobacteria bacterium]|nr:FAD-dependent thymidylate synthase [Alphaproteobacteria bacterium]
MISVKLQAKTNVNVTPLASYAAKVCYTAEAPQLGDLIKVKERLFDPGHHTTLEHNHFTFLLDGVSVSSVVFGIHLNAPYYNSDQRSGRFSKMYDAPNMAEIRENLKTLYPDENVEKAVSFVQKGADIYQAQIAPLTDLAARVIREERPLANDKYVEVNGKKFAQEQLRVFVSQVMPTALVTTVNVSALAALWRVAWSPEMRLVTDKMKEEVLKAEPDIAYMFDESKRSKQDWVPQMMFDQVHTKTAPVCRLISADIGTADFPKMADSVDILPFSPKAMTNNINRIRTEVEISAATMGQDQRHRSIKRGEPVLTGAFYVPPLLKMAGLEGQAQEYMEEYAALKKELSPNLMLSIAPYGVMAKYQKEASLNALMHEQEKRLCWCAQEEICEVARQLREQLKGSYPELADRLAPPCWTGGCREGVRFCGRQVNKNLVPDYFIRRRV